jgi:hypothetical protein
VVSFVGVGEWTSSRWKPGYVTSLQGREGTEPCVPDKTISLVGKFLFTFEPDYGLLVATIISKYFLEVIMVRATRIFLVAAVCFAAFNGAGW